MSKRNNKNKEITRISVSALLSALSYILLCIGTFIEALDLTVVMIASLPVLFCMIEMNRKYALMTYLTTSALSLLLLPGTRFPAMVYILFGGLYPILKPLFDKIKRPLSYIPKLIFAAVDFSLIFLLSAWLFPQNEELGYVMLIAFGLLCLFTFVLYDILLERVTLLYLCKWKKILGIKKI
jgi:hypothetical protein